MLTIRLILKDENEEYELQEKEVFISKEDYEELENIHTDNINIEDVDNVMQLSYKNIFQCKVNKEDFIKYFNRYSKENANIIYEIILVNGYTEQLDIDVYDDCIEIEISDYYISEDFFQMNLDSFNSNYDTAIKSYEELQEKAESIEKEKEDDYDCFTILNIDKVNNAILIKEN